MAVGKLSALQEKVLITLASIEPPWTLSGGGALAGFHTAHRETRDLDLFWQQQQELGDVVVIVRSQLERAALNPEVLQTQPAFSRLRVHEGEAVLTLDLVADPVPLAEAPQSVTLGEATFLVDTPHQILVNKLCAVLGRSELRDLEDIDVLLRAGADLKRALLDCPRQDAGFSPLSLSFCLRNFPIARLATASGWSEERAQNLERFKDEFIVLLMSLTKPA